MTLEEEARQALGELNLDARLLGIINARILMIIRASIVAEREACGSLAYAETEVCTRHHCCGEEIAAAIRART